MDIFDLQYRFFVVDERPYCLWDTNISDRVLKFLDSVDPSYYEYLANTHSQALSGDDSQRAALAIRAAYSQALETLFALICAAIQAPQCVPAWMASYRNQDLKNVVSKIHNNLPIQSLLVQDRLSWETVSAIIHTSLIMEDKERESKVKEVFGRLWSHFASDFLDDAFTIEYNSIKHGLRIRPGGFSLAIGAQEKPGIPAPPEKMQLLGKSEFGSSYLTLERIGVLSHHIRLRHPHRNWNPEDMAWGLHLISLSIFNVLSALKILNGVSAENVKFQWPTDDSIFDEPWKRSKTIGVIAMTGMDVLIPEIYIKQFTKETILSNYRNGKDAGVRRIKLNS